MTLSQNVPWFQNVRFLNDLIGPNISEIQKVDGWIDLLTLGQLQVKQKKI